MRVTVCDASVTPAWVIGDEPHSDRADAVAREAQDSSLRLIAPVLWTYEIVSGLRQSVRMHRLTREGAAEALAAALGLQIALYGPGSTAERSLGLSLEHGMSAYDASSLALAELAGCQCLTADLKLVNAAADTGLVRWIGDFE